MFSNILSDSASTSVAPRQPGNNHSRAQSHSNIGCPQEEHRQVFCIMVQFKALFDNKARHTAPQSIPLCRLLDPRLQAVWAVLA